MKNNNSKYFVVNDIKIASIMSALLNKKFYRFTNDKGKEIYTFERIPNINHVYGNAKTIAENLQ